MGKPFPKEFREDVVRVARERGPGVTLEQIASDFGVHPITLSKWLRRADVEDGVKPGVTSDQLESCVSSSAATGRWSGRTRCCDGRRVSVASAAAGKRFYPL